MAMTEKQREYIKNQFEELFADPSTIGEHYRTDDEYNYGYVVNEALIDENFPDDANHTNTNVEVEIRNNSDLDVWCDMFEHYNHISGEDEFEANKDDEDSYLLTIYDNIEMTEIVVTILDDVDEWLDQNPTEEYLAEQIEMEWDEEFIREVVPIYAIDYDEKLREAIEDDAFPDDVDIMDIEVFITDIEENTSFENMAAQFIDNVYSSFESVSEYTRENQHIFDALENGMVNYEIEVTSDPEDFH